MSEKPIYVIIEQLPNGNFFPVIRLNGLDGGGYCPGGFYKSKASAIRAARNWVKGLTQREVVVDE